MPLVKQELVTLSEPLRSYQMFPV